MANELNRLGTELTLLLEDSSRALYQRPKTDSFEHGVDVGRCQAVEDVLARISALLNNEDEDAT